MKRVQVWCAAVLVWALPLVADAATRFVAHTGADGPNCGVDATTACRSISQAIALARPGDTILVGPGRYGDLNANGVLGEAGEEKGAPDCRCVLSINKNVFVLSSHGAAVTFIDGTSVSVVQTVVLLSDGGEFGRPGQGFTVTETARRDGPGGTFDGNGIGIAAADVKVRGNRVLFSRSEDESFGQGIFTVTSAAILIEGNDVLNWRAGIAIRVAGTAMVSKNQVSGNNTGIDANGGTVIGNVATGNLLGIGASLKTTVSGNVASMNYSGFRVTAFTGVFTMNNILRNTYCGLENLKSELNAANNYWGASTGPGAPPADRVCNAVGSTTSTSQFATTPFAVTILQP